MDHDPKLSVKRLKEQQCKVTIGSQKNLKLAAGRFSITENPSSNVRLWGRLLGVSMVFLRTLKRT
jgi:hypothetical protein